ncbi:MAG: Fe-S protein assembly co-chaperone HscB [Saprospiraceae bacterium]|nr:Fe-S protein assembly co-chaperone HscB [Saprospiraceae bacterium]
MNYFEIFSIQPSLDFNPNELRKKYIQLSKEYHPDFSNAQENQSKLAAVEHFALINKAYQTLSAMDSRINYLLELNQLIQKDEKFQLPMEFLSEMMELNEAIQEAEKIDDKELCKSMILNLQSELNNELDHLKRIDPLHYDLPFFEKLKLYYYKNKYLNRLIEGLE